MLELLCSSNKIDRFLSWLKNSKWQVYLATSIRTALHGAWAGLAMREHHSITRYCLCHFVNRKHKHCHGENIFLLTFPMTELIKLWESELISELLVFRCLANTINLVACLLSFKVSGRFWARQHKQDGHKIASW